MIFPGRSSKESAMRKMFAGLTVAAFAVVMTVPVFAKTETVTGQIVD